VTRTFETLSAGCAAFGVADCGVTVAPRVIGEFFTMDTGDHVENVLAICGTTLGVSNDVRVDGVFTTTSLAPPALIVLAGKDPWRPTSVKPDRNRFFLGCGVVDVDPLVPEAECGVGVAADRWAPRMPANVFRLVRGLSSSPAPGDVEAAVDPDAVEVLRRPKGPAGVFFTGFESDAPPARGPLVDEPDESWESASAQAIPLPVNSAAPTPNATASPPIRPTYLEPFTDPPDPALECLCCGSCSAAPQ
jgi:hypothetical protein